MAFRRSRRSSSDGVCDVPGVCAVGRAHALCPAGRCDVGLVVCALAVGRDMGASSSSSSSSSSTSGSGAVNAGRVETGGMPLVGDAGEVGAAGRLNNPAAGRSGVRSRSPRRAGSSAADVAVLAAVSGRVGSAVCVGTLEAGADMGADGANDCAGAGCAAGVSGLASGCGFAPRFSRPPNRPAGFDSAAGAFATGSFGRRSAGTALNRRAATDGCEPPAGTEAASPFAGTASPAPNSAVTVRPPIVIGIGRSSAGAALDAAGSAGAVPPGSSAASGLLIVTRDSAAAASSAARRRARASRVCERRRCESTKLR